MPQSLSQLLVHMIFSTKGRHPWIDKSIQPELWSYLSAIPKRYDGFTIQTGGTEDHIHILFTLSRKMCVADMAMHSKTASSKWLKSRGDAYAPFQWQKGYGAFSVSKSESPKVKQYILNQETHHKKMTFQNEFIAFLKKHEIEYDEQYIWD
ncbi:transposase [Verrucomicrobia bacterium LW23]|nr:transposase [Verrucomicrobia bacterium LW23]